MQKQIDDLIDKFQVGGLKYLFSFAAFIGACKMFSVGFRATSLFYKHMLRSTPNLYQKYGVKEKETWAVITGGSAGIGEELCK